MQKIIALYYIQFLQQENLITLPTYSSQKLSYLICQNCCLFFKPHQMNILADTDDLPASNNVGGGVLRLFSDALGRLPIRRRGIQIVSFY